MNGLSPELLAQLYSQESGDPFLTLITLNHSSFSSPLRFVNNSVSIISNGNTFSPFPVKISLPTDDGETNRTVSLVFDNVSLELIDELRSVNGDEQIQVKLEMVLASIPNDIQMSLEELKVLSASYNQQSVTVLLGLDDILNTELSSERYSPSIYRGLF